MSINQLIAMVRRAQETSDENAKDLFEHRYLRFRTSPDGRSGRINGFLPIDMFNSVKNRTEAIGNAYGPDEKGHYRSADHLNADALHDLCGQDAVATDTKVIVTADLDAVNGVGNADIGFNGLILCDTHHRFVHEMGWTIEGDVYGPLTFTNPGGRTYTGRPPNKLVTETLELLLTG